jgi:hypothetical protein
VANPYGVLRARPDINATETVTNEAAYLSNEVARFEEMGA